MIYQLNALSYNCSMLEEKSIQIQSIIKLTIDRQGDNVIIYLDVASSNSHGLIRKTTPPLNLCDECQLHVSGNGRDVCKDNHTTGQSTSNRAQATMWRMQHDNKAMYLMTQ